MKEVRFGIIGQGNMGSAHAACLSGGNIAGACLTAICDLDEKRMRTPNVACFTDYREMFASGLIDAVIIAVPHRLHAAIAMEALTVGLHVLTEKPEDISVTQAARLNETASRSGKVFGIMFNQRTHPLFQKARELVHSGALGELKRTVWIVTNWYRTQHYYDSGDWRATWAGEGGGVLLNQAPHNLDLWQWICGMPVEVTGFCDVAKYHKIEVEDDATLFTRYANGATGVFITSTGEHPGTNRLEISGDRGKLVLENGKLQHWTLKTAERELCFTSEENSCSEEPDYEEIPETDPGSGHAGILQNFTDAILKGTPLLAPGTDGIYELMLSNAAYLSAWTGSSAVPLPLDGKKFDALLAERAARSGYVPSETEGKQSSRYSDRWQVKW